MSNVLDQVAGAILPDVFGQKPDSVGIRVGTRVIEGWKDLFINRSLDSLAMGFDFSAVDRWRQSGEAWPLVPGEQIRIYIGTTPIINGYIDRLGASISSEDRTFSISGRSKTADLVDCSAAIGVAEFNDKTITEIARPFAELHGIEVVEDVDVGEPFKKFTVKQGETVFEMLHRAAQLRGLLLITNTDGNLVITTRGAGGGTSEPPSAKNLVASHDFTAFIPGAILKSSVDLVQGQNVEEASANYDYTDRFSTYIVKGQSRGTDELFGKNAAQVEASATDPGVGRTRPKVIIADGNLDLSTAKTRARWEANLAARNAVDAQVKVKGWLRPDKSLWAPNEIVRCEIPFIGINAEMLISGVTYEKSQSGTFTTLALTRQDAYKGNQDLESSVDPTKVGELGWKAPTASGVIGQVTGLFT